MSRRLKVLISAYACEPHKGSEPAVGWNWIQQMARYHDVWVLTRENNRAAIEQDAFFQSHPNVRWIYFDFAPGLRFWKRGGRGIQLYYALWQIWVYPVARRLHHTIGFDVIHHVTLVRYWTPSLVGFLRAPFIFGPVGGGESTPPAFYSTVGWRGYLLEKARDFTRWVAEHEYFGRSQMRRAAQVFATTEETAARVRKMGAKRVSVRTPFALTQNEAAVFEALPAKESGPFRIISIGRLLHWKGFHLGLEAFARYNRKYPESEYWIVNEGPEMRRLRDLANILGVAEKVIFWGRLPSLKEVHDKLAQCDALVHPSLHDNFGNVCLEAMAAGRPVLCLDTGGPAVQVTDQCGFKASIASPEQAIAELAAAMEKLCRDSELRRNLGANGQARVREDFLWDKQGAEMNAVYESLAGEEKPKTIVPRPARLKVLMSAYACEPHKGSEPEVGWQWALQMARFHEVTVLTRTNNRAAIEAEVEQLTGKQPLPKFIYHDESPFLLLVKQGLRAHKLYYLLWQRSAHELIAEIQEREHFHLLHHVTFAAFRYPAGIWGHGLPNVWGPVGGIESVPIGLLPWSYPRALLTELARASNNLFQSTVVRILGQRARSSTVILASTPNMQETFAWLGFDAQLMPAIGLNTRELPTPPKRASEGRLKLLYVGNILALKGIHLALHAVKESRADVHFTLIGDGEFSSQLRQLVHKLGIEDRVTFRGRLPRSEALRLYAEHDVFIFPSLRDTGGYAVIEAMLNELPVICLNCGGPAVAVTDNCGVKVPVGPRREVITQLGEAIRRYDQDRDLLRRHGEQARATILQRYDWEKKGEEMNKIYQQAASADQKARRGSSKPALGSTPHVLSKLVSVKGLVASMLGLMLIGALGFLSLSLLKREASEIVNDTLPGISYAGQANAYLADASRTLLFLTIQDQERRTQIVAEIRQFSERTSDYLKRYDKQIFSAEDRQNYTNLMQLRVQYNTARDYVLELETSGEHENALKYYNDSLLPLQRQVKEAGDRLMDYNMRQGQSRGRRIMTICSITQMVVAAVGIVFFTVGFLIGLFK